MNGFETIVLLVGFQNLLLSMQGYPSDPGNRQDVRWDRSGTAETAGERGNDGALISWDDVVDEPTKREHLHHSCD